MSDPSLLEVIAQNRTRAQFETPESLREALGESLWAFVPSPADRDVADDARISSMASVQVRAGTEGDMVALLVGAEVQRKGRTAHLMALLARCVHYMDGDALRPIGAEVVASADGQAVTDMAYGLERAQAEIDPPVETMDQAEFDQLVNAVKKNASPAQIDGRLKSIDILTLRRFLLATVEGRIPSGTAKYSGSGQHGKRSTKKAKRKKTRKSSRS